MKRSAFCLGLGILIFGSCTTTLRDKAIEDLQVQLMDRKTPVTNQETLALGVYNLYITPKLADGGVIKDANYSELILQSPNSTFYIDDQSFWGSRVGTKKLRLQDFITNPQYILDVRVRDNSFSGKRLAWGIKFSDYEFYSISTSGSQGAAGSHGDDGKDPSAVGNEKITASDMQGDDGSSGGDGDDGENLELYLCRLKVDDLVPDPYKQTECLVAFDVKLNRVWYGFSFSPRYTISSNGGDGGPGGHGGKSFGNARRAQGGQGGHGGKGGNITLITADSSLLARFSVSNSGGRGGDPGDRGEGGTSGSDFGTALVNGFIDGLAGKNQRGRDGEDGRIRQFQMDLDKIKLQAAKLFSPEILDRLLP